jgi:hypothetical protein
VLARLSRLVSDSALLDEIRNAVDAREVWEKIAAAEQQLT